MEEKRENYIDLFDKCAGWLENNAFIRGISDWFQRHFKFVVSLVAVLVCVLYTWWVAQRQALELQEGAVAQLSEKIEGMAREIEDLKSASLSFRERLEKVDSLSIRRDESIRAQIDILRQIGALGKLPLSRVVLNGRSVSMQGPRNFWVRENILKLSGLCFGEPEFGQTVSATRDIRCTYTVNGGVAQEMTGIEDMLVIPLNSARESRFAILFSRIVFGSSEGEYTGFGSFTVNVDTSVPKLEVIQEKDSVQAAIEEQSGGEVSDGMSLKVSNDKGQNWTASIEAPGPFHWIASRQRHRISMPSHVLGEWERLTVSAQDPAGNSSRVHLRKLPCPRIQQASGIASRLPVMLNVDTSKASPRLAPHLYLEKFEDGEFKFLRETVAGALTLPEGRYRSRAFFVEDGDRGPLGDPVEFSVDITPPQAEMQVYQQLNRLYWQVTPSEENAKVWTSVKWSGGFQKLNAEGRTGNCELPAQAEEVTIQVRVQDQAGNENNLTKLWPCERGPSKTE